jgi:hypothetical protein
VTATTYLAAPGVMPDLAGPPGLRVLFYRPADGRDDSNGGLSSRHDQATVTGVVAFYGVDGPPPLRPLPLVMQVVRPTADAPAVWLARGPVPGDVFLIPADRPLIDGIPDLTNLSFGGNFAFSAHPMFDGLTGTHTAVRVHDRVHP